MLTFGDASIACVPGELYPEIANGGIVHPPGADFDIAPVEVPALRELMPGRVKFLFGLANDEVGYIIPKSEWDNEAPWLYGAAERHYGEINSLGPGNRARRFMRRCKSWRLARAQLQPAVRPEPLPLDGAGRNRFPLTQPHTGDPWERPP